MKEIKISNRTKKIALGAALVGVATMASIIHDKDKSIKIRNGVISTQDFYICDLEQFIKDNVTGYDFSYMVGIPE